MSFASRISIGEVEKCETKFFFIFHATVYFILLVIYCNYIPALTHSCLKGLLVPYLIILLVLFLKLSVDLIVLYVEQDVNFTWLSCLGLNN